MEFWPVRMQQVKFTLWLKYYVTFREVKKLKDTEENTKNNLIASVLNT